MRSGATSSASSSSPSASPCPAPAPTPAAASPCGGSRGGGSGEVSVQKKERNDVRTSAPLEVAARAKVLTCVIEAGVM